MTSNNYLLAFDALSDNIALSQPHAVVGFRSLNTEGANTRRAIMLLRRVFYYRDKVTLWSGAMGHSNVCRFPLVRSSNLLLPDHPFRGGCSGLINQRTNTMTNLLSLSDINTSINHEPRIHDLRLGEALGFANAIDIRKIIRRHEIALKRLGEVFATVAKTNIQGGRPATEYYLTKKQAIYITAKSETENAVDLTIHVIEVFDAAMNGEAHPALPKTTTVKSYTRRLPQKQDEDIKRIRMEMRNTFDMIGDLRREVISLRYVNYPQPIQQLIRHHLKSVYEKADTFEGRLHNWHNLLNNKADAAYIASQGQLQLTGRA